MKRRAFTLVEIMIVVAIIALLAAVTIPGLLRARIVANESASQANLKAISTAMETYAGANDGNYPSQESNLTGATPPYLNKAYIGQTYNGYKYATNGSLSATSYRVTARPTTCNTTGSHSYEITVGGVLTTDTTCNQAS